MNTLSGDSYDNTRRLDGIHWRHVKFIEQFTEDRKDGRWLMMSDVCKHCVQAPCLEVCPTGAIIRTEFDTVVIQSNVCNGCRDCIAACPFGVIDINPVSDTAQKCTLCYDRLQGGMEPACSQGLPDRVDPVRHDPRADADGAGSGSSSCTQTGEKPGVPLRRRRQDAGRAQLVLPAGRQAGGVRPAAGPEDADAQSGSRLICCRLSARSLVGLVGLFSFRNRGARARAGRRGHERRALEHLVHRAARTGSGSSCCTSSSAGSPAAAISSRR